MRPTMTEIYEEEPPPPSRTAVKHPKAPLTVQKTGLSSRKLLGELENGTVRKTTGKQLKTPATVKKFQRQVHFDVIPTEGGCATTTSPTARHKTKTALPSWPADTDDKIEFAAGRTYLQEREWLADLPLDDDDDYRDLLGADYCPPRS